MIVKWVQNSGEYKVLTMQAFNLAKLRSDESMKSDTVVAKPKAIILDIDETVLDNFLFFADLIINNKRSNQNAWPGWKDWTDKAKAKALPGAVSFLSYVAHQDINIFFSNRGRVEQQKSTLFNLKEQDFPSVSRENLKLKNHSSSSKMNRFKKIQDDYDLLLFLGDNLRDFSDKYYHGSEDKTVSEKVLEDENLFGTKFIILPNPNVWRLGNKDIRK